MIGKIRLFWRTLGITKKLIYTLSSLMLILLLIFFMVYFLLNHFQREIGKSVFNSQQINSMVLLMSEKLDASQRKEKEFFLHCKTIGFTQAYNDYVKPAYDLVSQVDAITPELKRLFKQGQFWQDSDINLKLLFMAQNRHRTTLNEATALFPN